MNPHTLYGSLVMDLLKKNKISIEQFWFYLQKLDQWAAVQHEQDGIPAELWT